MKQEEPSQQLASTERLVGCGHFLQISMQISLIEYKPEVFCPAKNYSLIVPGLLIVSVI